MPVPAPTVDVPVSPLRLTELLAQVSAEDERERHDLDEMQRFARQLERPFERAQWPAHFTGSAVVVEPQGARVCLIHHRKLDRWLQPGGHAEERDGGLLEVTALREAREETGLSVALHPAAPRPLDVDIHVIPARREEPEHRHLDVRFLVVAENPAALVLDPAEVFGARWLAWDEALSGTDEPALRRLLTKAWRQVRAPPSPRP
jgi:8-oxo-dGTP pyrophosphatase MutT (NUDIX family)